MVKFENIKYENRTINTKGTEKRIDITMWSVKEIENWAATQRKLGKVVKGLVVESKNHVYAIL